MAAWIGRSVREVVDFPAVKRTVGNASILQPAVAVRGVREAVKVEKAEGLVKLVGDVGRVQAKAGTQAALDGLKIAHGPKDMAKVATLAAAKGGKTRAILKLAGRSAIMLTMGSVQSRIVDVLGGVHGLRLCVLAQAHDRALDRALLRAPACPHRACAAQFAKMQALAEIEKRAAEIDAADERPVIYSSSSSLAPRSGRTEPTSLQDAIAALRGPLRTQVA